MENNRDDLVVILAGYADKMDQFFHSNPGFRSRVAHHIDFPDYADGDLMAIGGEDAGLAELQAEPRAQSWRSANTLRCAERSRCSRTRVRSATRWTAPACVTRTACSLLATLI